MTAPAPRFTPGDKVWAREGVMVLQHTPQTVIATYTHPIAGDWLWLDDGQCGFRSCAACHWTTEEPGQAELAARKERLQVRRAENAGFPPIPPEPVPPVRRGSSCPVHGSPLLWLGDGELICQEGHGYQIPEPQTGKTRARK